MPRTRRQLSSDENAKIGKDIRLCVERGGCRAWEQVWRHCGKDIPIGSRQYWRSGRKDSELAFYVEQFFTGARKPFGDAEVPDFAEFRRLCFGHENVKHQQEWIEAVENHDRTLILVPPEHGKTFTWAIEYPVWRICRDKNVRIILVCKNQDVAKKRLFAIKQRLTNSALYRDAEVNPIDQWGPFEPGKEEDLTWAATLIYVSGVDSGEKDPTVEALGLGNQIQGARADVIIMDDVADSKNQVNPAQVEDQIEWLSQEVTTRLAEGEDTESKLIIIGTRVNEADFYSHLLNEDNDWATDIAKVIRPAILDEETKEVLWPEKWPYDLLVSKRRSRMKPRTWALTYQQQSSNLPDAPFPEQLIEQCKDPYWPGRVVPEGLNVVMGVDPAMEGYCALVVLAIDRQTKQRFLVDCVARSGFANTGLLKHFIVETAAKYRVQRTRIEKNAMQGLLTKDNDFKRSLIAVGSSLEEEHTHQSNKFDPQWGVLSVAEAMDQGLYVFAGNPTAHEWMQPLVDELLVWRPIPTSRLKRKSDRVMAMWMAELSARQFSSYHPGMPTKRNTPLWAKQRSVPAWVTSARKRAAS